MVLGEMDVARMKPSWPGYPPSAQRNWVAPHQPTVEVRLMPGERRPPGPDCRERHEMGMDRGEDKGGIDAGDQKLSEKVILLIAIAYHKNLARCVIVYIELCSVLMSEFRS